MRSVRDFKYGGVKEAVAARKFSVVMIGELDRETGERPAVVLSKESDEKHANALRDWLRATGDGVYEVRT